MAARLKDVAALAGVSVKTASNVINDYPHVKASTRARVQAAIAELRYRPNESARQLKYGRAGFLALAVPHISEPYFALIATLFTQAARRAGFILLLEQTDADPAAERIVLDGMRSHVIDGLIFSPLSVGSAEIAERTDTSPMVLLGEAEVPAGYDHVAVDSVGAAAAMTTHLIELGRTRVAAIGDAPGTGTAKDRMSGYRSALDRAGLAFDSRLVADPGPYTRFNGRRAMLDLLDLPEPPDAVFCFNDQLAIGALRACAERGVAVPEQVAVAGFDDIDEGRYSTPSLTTVSADLTVLTEEALRLLLARVADRDRPAEDVSVPWRIVVRESTTSA